MLSINTPSTRQTDPLLLASMARRAPGHHDSEWRHSYVPGLSSLTLWAVVNAMMIDAHANPTWLPSSCFKCAIVRILRVLQLSGPQARSVGAIEYLARIHDPVRIES